MAIRIKPGTAPQMGRITNPVGTFLSSPSTVPDGGLGGASGMNPAVPQIQLGGTMWQGVTPGYNYAFTPNSALSSPNPFSEYAYKPQNPLTNPLQYAGSKISPGVSQQTIDIKPLTKPTTAFSTTTPGSSLVGNDLTSSPQIIYSQWAHQLAPNLSDAELINHMKSLGYTATYLTGQGLVYTKTGEASPDAQNNIVSAETDTRGRPLWVDPTQLAAGERVTDARGVTYFGGTPTAEGNAQYAVSYSNPNAQGDKHGRYKWTSTVVKNDNGDFVRVNKQVLRKVNTRSARRRKYANEEIAAQQPTAAAAPNDAAYNQLINFRANFG